MVRDQLIAAAVTALVLIGMGAFSILSLKPHGDGAQVLKLETWQQPDAELIVPVFGVERAKLTDSWGAPRDGGRTHKGIDIMAAQGTIVRATTAGKIIKLFESARGGTTIYQSDPDGRLIFYYAHLERYAAGLKVGQRVAQGETIGYVGKTGNAPVPHLHFEIQVRDKAGKWWRGTAFNPYPVLKAGKLELAAGRLRGVKKGG